MSPIMEAIAEGIYRVLDTLLPDIVTELPFGIQPYLEIFANQLSVAYSVLPPLETVVNVVLIGISVKIAIFLFHLIMKIIELIKPI